MDGKTMDGMGPGEWLFSRAVANSHGSDGVHLGVFPFFHGTFEERKPFIDDRGNTVINRNSFDGANLYFVFRENGKETALEGTEVEVIISDCFGIDIVIQNATIDENGIASFSNFHCLDNDGEIHNDEFTEFSATRYIAKAVIDGKEYTDVNFGLNTFRDDNITATDNRMFFILINEDETINTSLKDIEVSGAYGVDKAHLNQGSLIVQANQGDNVTVNGQEYTKPVGARIIPFIVD